MGKLVRESSPYYKEKTDEVLSAELDATEYAETKLQKLILVVKKIYPFRSSMSKVLHFPHPNLLNE